MAEFQKWTFWEKSRARIWCIALYDLASEATYVTFATFFSLRQSHRTHKLKWRRSRFHRWGSGKFLEEHVRLKILLPPFLETTVYLKIVKHNILHLKKCSADSSFQNLWKPQLNVPWPSPSAMAASLKLASLESLVLLAHYMENPSVLDKRDWKRIVCFKSRLTHSSYNDSWENLINGAKVKHKINKKQKQMPNTCQFPVSSTTYISILIRTIMLTWRIFLICRDTIDWM